MSEGTYVATGLRWSAQYNLNSKTYRAWKTRVDPYIRALGFMGILTKEEMPPDRGWATRVQVDSFWKREAHAKATLIGTLSDSVVLQVATLEYACEIWATFKHSYEGNSWGALAHVRASSATSSTQMVQTCAHTSTS